MRNVLTVIMLFVAVAAGAQIHEQKLFTTTFTDWRDVGLNNNSPVNVKKHTRFTDEVITFKVYDTQISSDNKNAAKFPLWKGGYLMAAKADDACVTTSPLKSITKVHFRHGATGSFRGWKLEAKGDGDSDWVTVSDASAEPPAGSDVTAKVNRTNCQLRFTNIEPRQNAYLFQLDIYGNVDMTGKETPVFTVTYHDADGTPIARQSVKQDSPIGKLNDGNTVTLQTAVKGKSVNGGKRKFRGWLLAANGSRKATSATVVTDDLDLYPLVTDVEGDEPFERNVYDFASPCFYPEDHEALDVSGSSPRVKLNGNAVIIASTAEGVDTMIDYKGRPTTITLPFKRIDIDKVIVINTGSKELKPSKDGSFVAEPGNANSILGIFDIISYASQKHYSNHKPQSSNLKPQSIYLPNDTYDFGNMTEIQFPADNISIIGESRDSTILVTTPEIQKEGLGTADFFYNTHEGIYFKNLTLKNALAYYEAGGAGRAAVIQDCGNHTIYNNVRMLSYQDTYYSQNNNMQSYFRNCEIHGTVDFICGGGDVRFDSCEIVLEKRKKDGTGSRIITAPSTTTKSGYVFDHCRITDLSEGEGDWNFGRTWRNCPVSVFLNTTLDSTAEPTLIRSRWVERGMNNANPRCFGEYSTKNINGKDITPESNIITSYDGAHETVLKKEQADDYSYDKMFTDWNPRAVCQ